MAHLAGRDPALQAMEGLCFGVAFFVSSGRGEKHKIDEAGAILLWVTLFFGKGGGELKKKNTCDAYPNK